jgi:hypothetical protein
MSKKKKKKKKKKNGSFVWVEFDLCLRKKHRLSLFENRELRR